MNVAIVTNHNGIGLTRDFELLRDFLAARGHEVTGYQFDELPKDLPTYPLAIFLEVLPRHYLALSDTLWWFPNVEWIKGDMLHLAERYFAKVFAKTREAQRILEPLLPGKVHYTGFLCRDQYDASVPRERKFLHLGGNSSLRGTEAVLDAWRWEHDGKTLFEKLTVVSTTAKKEGLPPNVTILDRVSEEELKRLQNSHYFHLLPSGTEGFGHALHESLSVDAFLVSTGAPPMNEVLCAQIPSCGKRFYNLATVYDVSAIDIYRCVETLRQFRVPLPGFATRQHFEKYNAATVEALEQHLADFAVAPVVGAPRQREFAGERKAIAFLGNFCTPESTESMLAWAMEERLGLTVHRLQENHVGIETLRDAVQVAEYFVWVRTPGWLKVSDKEMYAFLMDLSIPSISIHLDKFWGIPDRERLIGRIPFWQTDFVFTADGSRNQDFEARSVSHYYMRPAASEVFHHRGRAREEWRCDVAFVGARTYHQEHPWRGQLISFLEQTYGERFKLIEGGLRGHDLNDFYASARVVVGDCFGSGKIPYYFSDRMVETPLRYGFLLSPDIEGLEIPLATFEPENLYDLQEKIDWWLAHDAQRREKIDECAKHVAVFDTWTERLRWIFFTVNDARKSDQSVRSKIGQPLQP